MSWFSKPIRPVRWLQLHFTHDLDPSTAQQLLRSLLAARDLGIVVFEAHLTTSGLAYRVGAERPGRVARLIGDFLPEVTVEESERRMPTAGWAWRVQTNNTHRPWRIDDFAAASTAVLGSLRTSSSVSTGYQLVIGERLDPAVVPDKLSITPGETWQAQVLSAALGRSHRVEGEARRATRDKQSMAGARVSMRLFAHGKTEPPRSLPAGFLGAIRSRQTSGLRFDLRRDEWQNVLAGSMSKRPLALNSAELLGVLAWPYGEHSYPGLNRQRSTTRPATAARPGDRVLGQSTHPGKPVSVGLSSADSLRHLHVLGPTGVGKSTLLLNLILQDIEAGRAVVVIEPKGDLVDDVLARIHESHIERTVIIDPARTDNVVGFNPLDIKGDANLPVDGILHVFRKLNASSWGPRTQDILHASLLTLAQTSKTKSLIFVPDLLVDARFRSSVLNQAKLPAALVGFWRWFQDLSDAERASVIAPVLNKLRPFTMRPNLLTVLGSPKPFDLNRVFTEKKVLLVPLRTGSLGSEVAHLFGALLMSRLWQLTQARSAIKPALRHPVSLYADEFQNYTAFPTDFDDVLVQARGLGLGMTLAHQNLHQLDSSLRATVLANVQNQAYFRLQPEDAAVIVKRTDGLRIEDFVRLPRYEIYARLLRDAEATPVSSVRTAAPPKAIRNPHAVASEIAMREGQPPVDPLSAAGPQATDDSDEQIGRAKRGPK